jgi:hypothetical protein
LARQWLMAASMSVMWMPAMTNGSSRGPPCFGRLMF